MKLVMAMFLIGGKLLNIKLDFTFDTFSNLKSDMSEKLKNELVKFRNGLNWYPQRVIGVSDLKKFMVGIMKLGLKMEHPSSIVIRVSGVFAVLVSV